MKKVFLFLILFIFFSSITACQLIKKMPIAQINQQKIKLVIAKTSAEKIKGLGGMDFLPADSGMLFEYSDYQIRSFWMKGMNFPIDIVWIKDDKIIGFAKNVMPPSPNLADSQLLRYLSDEPINFVLELNSGWIDNNQAKIGDIVHFSDLE